MESFSRANVDTSVARSWSVVGAHVHAAEQWDGLDENSLKYKPVLRTIDALA